MSTDKAKHPNDERKVLGGVHPYCEGSKAYPCVTCDEKAVWLAPTGQREVRKGATVICARCFLKDFHAGKDIMIEPRRQEDLMADILGRHHN
jgi:hypothetical protein